MTRKDIAKMNTVDRVFVALLLLVGFVIVSFLVFVLISWVWSLCGLAWSLALDGRIWATTMVGGIIAIVLAPTVVYLWFVVVKKRGFLSLITPVMRLTNLLLKKCRE